MARPMAGTALAHGRRSLLADVNGANIAAGLTAGLWYAFGGVALHLKVAADLRLTPAATSSWFFIVCCTAGLSGIVLTLRYRQPLSIGATIPGWVFLAGAGDRYTLPEIAGASLMAGIAIVALGPLGIGERLMRWLPLPIVLGMFAGSSLGQVTAVFQHLGTEPATVGAAIAGYLGARALARAWLPPVALAGAAGVAVAALSGQVQPGALRWSPPLVAPVWPSFGVGAFFALSVPLVVMAVGIGNVQGLGFLVGQGYRPPIGLLTAVVGLNSIVNALFGGHPSTVARNGVAIVAGEDAGPRDRRYVANLVASLCLLLLALGATMASALPRVLSPGLVATLAGLAILGALMDALRKAVTADLSVGAFFALVIAASPLTLLGVGSAFWALIGGLLVSRLLERPALVRALAPEAPTRGAPGAATAEELRRA